MLYDDVKAICKSYGIISNVFDFTKDDFMVEYLKLFEFGQGAFNKYIHFDVQPGLFIFNDSFTLNARAGYVKNHYVIDYNMGTVWFTMTNFFKRPDLLNLNEMQGFKRLARISDYPINELWHQACVIFTFYHEFGHLIQKRCGSNDAGWMNGEINQNNGYTQLKHLLEFDADVFSALCFATHIFQYIDKWLDGKVIKDYEDFIGLMGAVLFLYLLSFSSMNNKLYFKVYSHPHPIIRILNIISILNDHLEQILFEKTSKKVNINKRNTILIAIKVAEILSTKLNLPFDDFKQQYLRNYKKIGDYIRELWNEIEKLPNGSFNRWNEHAFNVKAKKLKDG